MGDLLKKCNQLMEGLAFDQKSKLMERLSPLVEKMHYSIAAEVNQRLGGGLRYVLPGKTPSNPEFGGLFTLKPSDHDAIYLGAADKADEAVKIHREIARIYGDDFHGHDRKLSRIQPFHPGTAAVRASSPKPSRNSAAR